MNDFSTKNIPDTLSCLITHNDLDAAGSVVLIKKFLFKNINTFFCEAMNIDKILEDFISQMENDLNKKGILIITDNCTNNLNLINRIIELNKNNRFKFLKIFDHHPINNEFLKNIKSINNWSILTSSNICATKSIYNYIKNNYPSKDILLYENFSENVNDWDTYNWKNNNNLKACELNLICSNTSRRNFINRFLINSKMIWSAREKELIEKINIDIANTLEHYKPIFVGNTCYVFTKRFVNQISDDIFEKYPEIKINILIDIVSGFVSMRSRSDEFRVDTICKENGGGGHFCASGFNYNKNEELNKTLMEYIVNKLFKNGFIDYTNN